jgi:CPA2 family monovalent cation:H+ antiporter-2
MVEHTHTIIQDLAIIMLVAGIMAVLCRLLKQPMVFGYLLTGVILGPHTPPFSFITDEVTIKTLGELGVILLMFTLGLEFSFAQLKKVGAAAFITATIEIVVMLVLGFWLGKLLGWHTMDCLFLGAVIAISSTTIILKALEEMNLKQEKFAQLIFGILIVEDLFAILILALLSSMGLSGNFKFQDTYITVIELASFLVVSFLIGLLVIPKILAYIAKFKSKELLLVSVLGICFGFCLLVIKLDYSIALGAFIIGAIVAESSQHLLVERLINPIKDMFVAIFFVSVGLLFNPESIVQYWKPILLVTLLVVVGKILTTIFGALVTRNDGKTSLKVGMGLAQIGEFSFIIAALGKKLDLTSDFIYPIAVAVSAITTLLTPYFIRASDPLSLMLARVVPTKVASSFKHYREENKIIDAQEKRLNKKSKRTFIQIIVNLLTVTAIYLSCEFIAKSFIGKYLTAATNLYIQRSIVWGIALLVSLPFLIAIYRKSKLFTYLMLKLRGIKKGPTKKLNKWQRYLLEFVPILILTCLLTLASAITTDIIPPARWLFFVLIVAAVILAFLFPWLLKIQHILHKRLMQIFQKSPHKTPK